MSLRAFRGPSCDACSKSYWTVVHTPGGLAFPRLAITVAPTLNLLVFSSGAIQHHPPLPA